MLHEQFDTLNTRTLSGSSGSGSGSGGAGSTSVASTSGSGSTQVQQQQLWWRSMPIRPTVIQIAHELSAIMSYDTVALMSGGQVVELGNPRELAAQEGSRFSRLRAQEGH